MNKLAVTDADNLVLCPLCKGDEKERCDNPDHRFLEVMSFHDVGRIGCPVCGHDPEHIVPNGGICLLCSGEKYISKDVAEAWGDDL